MAKKAKTLTAAYEALPKIVKILIQIFFGWIFGGAFRIVRFAEKGNLVTLIAGLVCCFSGVGNAIAWVLDLVTEILQDKIVFLAD